MPWGCCLPHVNLTFVLSFNTVSGVEPISQEDYFNKSTEFRAWLSDEVNIMPSMFPCPFIFTKHFDLVVNEQYC